METPSHVSEWTSSLANLGHLPQVSFRVPGSRVAPVVPQHRKKGLGVPGPLTWEHVLPLMSFFWIRFSFILLILSLPSGFYLMRAAVFSIENNTLTSFFFARRVFSFELLLQNITLRISEILFLGLERRWLIQVEFFSWVKKVTGETIADVVAKRKTLIQVIASWPQAWNSNSTDISGCQEYQQHC